jgi:hypothetical protein
LLAALQTAQMGMAKSGPTSSSPGSGAVDFGLDEIAQHDHALADEIPAAEDLPAASPDIQNAFGCVTAAVA